MSGSARRLIGLVLAVAGAAVALGYWVSVSQPPAEGVLQNGIVAPGFSLERLGGGSLSLDELRGKVVYVHLWATWCGPCRTEAPALEQLYKELQPQGFEVVGVAVPARPGEPGATDPTSEQQLVQDFRDEYGFSFPIVLDAERAVYDRYQATGVPETYLVDRNGKLFESYIGPRDWNDPRYARVIRKLLTTGGQSDGKSGKQGEGGGQG